MAVNIKKILKAQKNKIKNNCYNYRDREQSVP
jgi:hypothetical protein